MSAGDFRELSLPSPAVVTYWQVAEDESDFLGFLQSTGTVLALTSHWVEMKEELIPEPIVSFIERHNPEQLLFGLEEHVLGIVFEEHSVGGRLRFSLPYMEPCVIAYSRGKCRGRQLALSNLSAHWDYPSRDKSRILKKDESFKKWASKVMAWVRKFTPERIECIGYAYRATKRTKTAVSEGRLEVALY